MVRFIGGKPSTEQQAWSRLMNYRGHWDLMEFGYWAVEEKSSGLYIGDVGFADFKREMSPSFGSSPEIGWVMMPSHHGRGLASEALQAALAWGDSHLATLERSVCMIDPGNAASIRVAEKCGFVSYGRTEYLGEPVNLFERAFRD